MDLDKEYPDVTGNNFSDNREGPEPDISLNFFKIPKIKQYQLILAMIYKYCDSIIRFFIKKTTMRRQITIEIIILFLSNGVIEFESVLSYLDGYRSLFFICGNFAHSLLDKIKSIVLHRKECFIPKPITRN